MCTCNTNGYNTEYVELLAMVYVQIAKVVGDLTALFLVLFVECKRMRILRVFFVLVSFVRCAPECLLWSKWQMDAQADCRN